MEITTAKGSDTKLLQLWREVVIARAGGKCEYVGCYKTDNLNAHHVFTRGKKCVRYDPDNGLCLCPYHHTLGNESAHKDPAFISKITGQQYGFRPIRTKQWFDLLERKAWTPRKPDLFLEELFLKKELAKYDPKTN